MDYKNVSKFRDKLETIKHIAKDQERIKELGAQLEITTGERDSFIRSTKRLEATVEQKDAVIAVLAERINCPACPFEKTCDRQGVSTLEECNELIIEWAEAEAIAKAEGE